MQKKAIRAILGLPQRQSCREHFKTLNITTVISLYILSCINYVHEHKGDFNIGSSIHNHQTRKNFEIRGKTPRNEIFLRSFVHQAVIFYNKIPLSLQNLDIKSFRQITKSILKSKIYYSIDEYLNDENFYCE